MNKKKLTSIVKKIMEPKKGILAIDESVDSANKKRLGPLSIKPTKENRRRFRELFLVAEDIEKYLSGVILFDETMLQSDSFGNRFVDVLKNKKIAIGIKVDQGTKESDKFTGEKITSGLDGLGERLDKYVSMGAVFCKWRSVINIDEKKGLPTDGAIRENCHILSLYAQICHKKNMIPIIEPEVLIDGSHTMSKSGKILSKTLDILFKELKNDKVFLPYVILKTSMVIPGSKSGQKMDSKKIAQNTVKVLIDHVPHDLGGIVFLSGGQTHDQATKNLNEIAKYEPLPWPIAFSYARAIQSPVLNTWKGQKNNIELARKKYLKVLEREVLADQGLL